MLFGMFLACAVKPDPPAETGSADTDTDTASETGEIVDPCDTGGTGECCTNGVDDDGNGRIDGEDLACPLRGDVRVRWTDGDLRNGIETRPVILPATGDVVLWSESYTEVTWYSLAEALEGTWTVLGQSGTDAIGALSIQSMTNLPDVDGDGETGLVVDLARDVARYATGPATLHASDGDLVVEDVNLLGLTGDLDGDTIPELVVGWQDTWRGRSSPFLGWVSGAASGQGDVTSLALATSLLSSNASPLALPWTAEPFDPQGDGVDETLLVVGAWPSDYRDNFYEGHGAYVIEGLPTTTYATGVAAAEVHATGDYGLTDATSLGDTNGDGYDDLAVATEPLAEEWNAAVVYLLLGPLSGTPSEADAVTTFPGLTRAQDLSAGDLDGDGSPDLLLASTHLGEDCGDWLVYLDPASGGARTEPDLRMVNPEQSLLAVSFYDLDADGLDDLLGSSFIYAR